MPSFPEEMPQTIGFQIYHFFNKNQREIEGRKREGKAGRPVGTIDWDTNDSDSLPGVDHFAS